MRRSMRDIAEKAAETNRRLRKDWGSINPVTKVIPNKKKNDPKYGNVEEKEYDEELYLREEFENV